MSRKAFLVQVELDVQAVTCPGVWLCANGKVSLQIYMLDSCVQTASYKPVFPIQCNETFVFYKTFFSTHRLNDLQSELHDQWLYIELVQWQSCEVGNVLASFQTTLDELLYPSTISGSIAGVDLDLLMEPSKTFPGAISPKVEVSTKTTIEETLCVCKKPSSSTVVVNPKVLMSAKHNPRRNVCRKVCHSIAYSRRKPHFKSSKAKPPFRYRRVDDNLILRKPQYDLDNNYCSCRKSKSLERTISMNPVRRRKPELGNRQNECPCAVRMCSCGSGHKENFCPVCSKYKGYFNVTPDPDPTELQKTESHSTQPRTTLFDARRSSSKHQKKDYCPCCRPADLATNEDKSDSQSNLSDTEQKKVCFCNAEKKPSLAGKLHEKLKKTLSEIPRSVQECFCYDDNEYDYSCECPCPSGQLFDRKSRAELYRDLQKFYGDLYEKTRSNLLCLPDCIGRK